MPDVSHVITSEKISQDKVPVLMDHDYLLSIVLLACLMGCGDAKTTGKSGDAGSTVRSSVSTASLVDRDGVKHRLPQVDSDFLAGLISAQPDVDTTDRIKLDSEFRVIVAEVDLVLQPDELILIHQGGTRIWKSSGVRARILAAAGIEH